MYKFKMKKGFLLIELLIALAILSGLIVIVTTQIWLNLKLQKEAQLRMNAINAAISTAEKFVSEKKIFFGEHKEANGITIIVQPKNIQILQKTIDSELPVLTQAKINNQSIMSKIKFEPISITAKWKSLNGKIEKVCLLTGILVEEKI